MTKRSPKRNRPKRETYHQRILRLFEKRKCGLLPVDAEHPCPCPKRGGPDHPHPDRPGMVWHLTCSGCPYLEGLFFHQHVCTHPHAHQTAAAWLSDAIRRREEQQQSKQLSLF